MTEGAPASAPLLSAISALARRVQQQREEFANLSDMEFVDRVVNWPEIQAVNDAAGQVARIHDYLPYKGDGAKASQRWGRRLTSHNLRSIGVIGMLRAPIIPDDFAADLAGYLGGPAIRSELLVVIDADLPLSDAHEVAGWYLDQPSAADLDRATPLPSAKAFAADPWDPALRTGGCCVLRRTFDDLVPRQPSFLPHGVFLNLFEPELTIAAWEPLLLLNLAQPERVVIAAEYEIEPGRTVERVRGTGLDLLPTGYDGVEEWEQPGWGPCRLDDAELADLLAFIGVMSPLLVSWQAWETVPKAERKRAKSAWERLRRSAHRFLALGPRLGVEGDVLYERDRAEIVFWYVSALENLMITDSPDADFSRKVSQRTAVLIGTDDNERLEIRRAIARAYGIRSKVAHGDVTRRTDLRALPGQLRTYLRRAFCNLIILGPNFDVGADCDDALLSGAIREQRIAAPIQQVVQRLPAW